MNGLDKILIGIGNTRQQRGYGGRGGAELERLGLVTIDPEWSGCLTLTGKGWDRYQQLTQTDAEREHPEWYEAQQDVSDQDIRDLEDAAGTAGDLEQVALCRRALEGDTAARAECARVLLYHWQERD